MYNFLKNKIYYLAEKTSFLDNRILFIILLVIASGLYIFNNYFLIPDLEKQQSQQQSISGEKLRARNEMNPDQYINAITSFASVDNKKLWIHKLKITNNNIDLVIRSSDLKAIEEYINVVTDYSGLKLESLVTKNVKSKASGGGDDEEEEEKAPVPFAVKLYLDSIESSEPEESEEDDESKNAELIYIYETKVKLVRETM